MIKIRIKPFLFVFTLLLLVNVTKSGAQTLIVVHPTSLMKGYHGREGAPDVQTEINKLVGHFLDRGKKVITLVGYLDDTYTDFMPRIKETQIVDSIAGENEIRLNNEAVYFAGGFLDMCFRRALGDFIDNNIEAATKLDLNLVTPAIYGKNIRVLNKENINYRFNSYLANLFENHLQLHSVQQKSKLRINIITNTAPLN